MPLILTRKQSMRLGLGLLASFFIVSGLIIRFRNSPRLPASSTDLTQAQVQGTTSGAAPSGGLGFVLNDFHRSLERDGKLVWDIVGKRGQYDAGSNRAQIDEPRLLVVQENGDRITLTARRAEIVLSGTKLAKADLFDDVVVTFKGDSTLKTTKASYDEAAGRIDIPVPLTLTNPMVSVSGKKAVGLVEPQQVTISGGVETVIQPQTRKK